jgi:hypothetical protein
MASKRKSTVDRITEIGIVLVDLYGGREWSTNALVNYAASLLQNLNNLKLVTRPYSGSVGIKESNLPAYDMDTYAFLKKCPEKSKRPDSF